MTKLEFVAENGNIRIDKYIADNEPSLTRTAAAKLIEQGKVFVNENSVGKNYKLKSGDRITLEIPDPVPYEAKPENITRITICLLLTSRKEWSFIRRQAIMTAHL